MLLSHTFLLVLEGMQFIGSIDGFKIGLCLLELIVVAEVPLNGLNQFDILVCEELQVIDKISQFLVFSVLFVQRCGEGYLG